VPGMMASGCPEVTEILLSWLLNNEVGLLLFR